MNLSRVLHDGEPVWAILEGGVAYRAEGDIHGSPTRGARLGEAAGIRSLYPLEPASKCINLLGNWGARNDRDGPGFFVKPPSAFVSPGDTVIYPEVATRVNLEPELAAIIGRTCSRVTPEQARGRILGYTVSNDVTAFETTKTTNFAPLYGKSFDTFGVMGPQIVTDLDPGNLTLRAALNGEEFLTVNTGDMLWDVFEAVSWISQAVSLFPGDAVSMGAPPGFDARNVEPGDRMTVTIDGIGSIENPVRRRDEA